LSYHHEVCKHTLCMHDINIYIQKYNTTGPCHRPLYKMDVVIIIFFFTTLRSVLMDCFNPVHGVRVKFPIRHTACCGNRPSVRQTQRRITRAINGCRRVDRSAGDELSASLCVCVLWLSYAFWSSTWSRKGFYRKLSNCTTTYIIISTAIVGSRFAVLIVWYFRLS
jgi:hypothetical protein